MVASVICANMCRHMCAVCLCEALCVVSALRGPGRLLHADTSLLTRGTGGDDQDVHWASADGARQAEPDAAQHHHKGVRASHLRRPRVDSLLSAGTRSIRRVS